MQVRDEAIALCEVGVDVGRHVQVERHVEHGVLEGCRRADIGELLRTTGFAASPGLLRVLGFVPELGFWILVGVSVWIFMAMVIAVRQALDYESLERAVGVCLIGWFVQVVILTQLG